MKFIPPFLLLSFLFTFSLWSATPVPYSGKIDIRGVNYFGEAQFAFSLHDGNGTTHWRNGKQPGETIKVTIRNGRYSVLLGGQGMNSLPPELFLNHDKLYLKVEFDNEDGEGLRHLAPDQLITATPRALVADLARVSELAKISETVSNGAITRDMLSSEVLAKLDANSTASPSAPITITRDMLPKDVRDDLNKTIVITRSMLPTSVLNDLNKTIVITREMLPQDVRDDLNKSTTITFDMLPQDVRNDLNKTIVITRDMLPQDVQDDLNRTLIITRQMLPKDVRDDLNHSISAGSISLEMLAPEVRSDLNRTITKSMLGGDVFADLNQSIKTVSRDMLPASVLADLNRTITKSMLGSDVLADLNKTVTITRDMLPQDVRDDLNKTITIIRNMLPADVLSDLNRTITKSMLSSSILADLNRTVTKNNLGSDVLSDLNSSISLNRLSPEVLAALQVTPSISTQPFARYDWRTDSATIEARGRGHNLSYQWLKNGQVISGANAPVLELSNPVLDDNATYSVQLTNSVGQTTSQTITLQQAIGAPGLPLEEANATQVPRNGLVLWLDANDLNADGHADSLLVGDRVSSWTDKINEKNATQSDLNKQPVKATNGSVSFDGSDSLGISDLNVTANHIFIVAKLRSSPLFGDLIKNESDNNMIRFYYGLQISSNAGNANLFNFDTGSNRISAGEPNAVAGQLFVATISRGSSLASDGNFAGLQIAVKGMHEFDGEISEILFYDRFLQNNERDAVELYLADKWGIQLHENKIAAEQAAYDAAKPPAEPESGLQAYYKFEPLAIETEKVWDYSGNDNHLTMSGFDGDPWGDGVDGKALAFDGGNSMAWKNNGPNLDPGTICFWTKPSEALDASDNPNVIFRQKGSNIYQYLGFNKVIEGQGRHLALWKSGSSIASAVKIGQIEKNPEGWIHVAIIYNESTARYGFYLNGQPLETEHFTQGIGLPSGLSRINTGHEINIGNMASPYYRGLLDEFRIYNRSLTAAEVEGLYLQVDSPIMRMAPEHNATVGTNFSLSLAADNGPTTYLTEGLPAGLSLNTTTGQITGSLSHPGYHRVFVKAMNEHGTGSDTIAIVARPQTDQYGWPVDVPDGSAIPQNGLVLWLDANDVDADGEFDTSTDHLKLSNWADKAGKDHNATQATAANQPEIRSGQISGKPNLNILVFDGNQSLSFPAIAQGRTFFWVLNSHAQGRGGANFIGNDTPDIWGNNQQSYFNTFQFTTTNNDVGTQIKNGVWNKNGLTGSGRIFFNFDQLPFVLSLVTEGMVPSELIGKRGGSGQHFIGNIGEILIYDQVLLGNQIETVEKYLGQKWGISISHDTSPSPSGNPPTFSVTPANDSVTTAHLSEQILKYLKPEITTQPQAQTVYADTNASFSVTAEGKYLTYQWKKDGVDLTGETNTTLNITDANATQHDGNYSVVVSNDFGGVESNAVLLDVNTTLLNGLIGWWKFDETSGNIAYDSSGNGNDGNLTNGPSWTSGKIGGALSFDGVNDIVNVPTIQNVDGGGITFSAWIKPTHFDSRDYPHIIGGAGVNLHGLGPAYIPSNKKGAVSFYLSTSADGQVNTRIVPLLSWSHVSAISNGATHLIFWNGIEEQQSSKITALLGNSPLSIGGITGGSDYIWLGLIDDVRIYDRALSAAEVQALYNLGQ